jgi:hypothetical protein
MNRTSALALVVLVATLVLPAQALASSPNGSAGEMPAFYDGQLFTINFKQQPSGGEASLLAHNRSINTIYMSDQAEAAGVMFTSVLDAIQGDGFNPLWQEVQIVFKTIPPQQFFSDTQILAAAAAGQIALVPTTEVYRCSVVGTK